MAGESLGPAASADSEGAWEPDDGQAPLVLFVVNTLPPIDLSGVGEQVLQLAHGLRQRGLRTEILGRGPGGARGPKLLFPITILPSAANVIRRLRPRYVQLHESDGGLLALLLRVWRPKMVQVVALQQVSYRREMRVVAPVRDRRTGQELATPNLSERQFRWLRGPFHFLLGWLTARCSDFTLAPSSRTAMELREDYGVTEVAVVPNATGAPVASHVRDRAPGKSGGSPGTAHDGSEGEPSARRWDGPILFVGRLRLRKGVEVLLHALASLREQGIPAPVEIVGDGERRVQLEQLSERLGLEDQVTFVGRLDARGVAAKLECSRALAVPSLYEGMPLVILEAMSRGTPVVASAVSGIPEVVVDGETGWLVPSRDVSALAVALREVWQEPEECSRRGLAGARRLDSCYRPADAAAAWLRAVKSVKDPS